MQHCALEQARDQADLKRLRSGELARKEQHFARPCAANDAVKAPRQPHLTRYANFEKRSIEPGLRTGEAEVTGSRPAHPRACTAAIDCCNCHLRHGVEQRCRVVDQAKILQPGRSAPGLPGVPANIGADAEMVASTAQHRHPGIACSDAAQRIVERTAEVHGHRVAPRRTVERDRDDWTVKRERAQIGFHAAQLPSIHLRGQVSGWRLQRARAVGTTR